MQQQLVQVSHQHLAQCDLCAMLALQHPRIQHSVEVGAVLVLCRGPPPVARQANEELQVASL